jgi:hypothetical protein
MEPYEIARKLRSRSDQVHEKAPLLSEYRLHRDEWDLCSRLVLRSPVERYKDFDVMLAKDCKMSLKRTKTVIANLLRYGCIKRIKYEDGSISYPIMPASNWKPGKHLRPQRPNTQSKRQLKLLYDIARKQPVADKQRRLNRGLCPVHGACLTQVGNWEEQRGGAFDGAWGCVCQCTRKKCGIQAVKYDSDGAYELLPRWQYLLTTRWGEWPKV